MRRAKPRKVDAVPGRRRFLEKPAARLKPASPPASLHYGAGVASVGVPAVGGVTAALLLRRLRTPLPPPEPRLGLAKSTAAAALVRDRRRSPASCVTPPRLPRE